LSPSGEWRQTTKRILARLRLLGVTHRLLGVFQATKFRLHETITAAALGHRQSALFRAPAPDGLPLPPAKLMVLVGGSTNAPAFFSGGETTARVIDEMLQADGADVRRMKSLLDFGCGCGRVIRHWRSISDHVALHGTDYNRALIGWCRRNLRFAQFAVNRLKPPLDYPDNAFDLVYAFSIFTHLPADLQEPWISELARVTAPGGYVFLTLHGDTFRQQLSPEEQAAFDAGQLVVRHAQMAGSNMCSAFHPADYIRRVIGRDLRVVQLAPARLGQDALLLRKPRTEDSDVDVA
jgi:SAM-dependent methyltransferase